MLITTFKKFSTLFYPPTFFVKQIDTLRINFTTKKGYRPVPLRNLRGFLLKKNGNWSVRAEIKNLPRTYQSGQRS